MASNQDMLIRDMAHLQISAKSQQQYSPGSACRKMAPAIPPKPSNQRPDAYCTSQTNGSYSHTVNYPGVPSPQVASHAREPVYSNYQPEDDLPPPPPPASYSPPLPCESNYAPISPAGSTYGMQSGYSPYGPGSPMCAYDTSSIYEPITPRPPSQMSNRSNYSSAPSPYSPYYSNVASRGTRREEEVDRLTNLMVQSMNASDEFYGMCYKCNEKVLGEGSGCTAMDQVYHIACFTCHICQKELRGKPFYAKDGKPFCEDDYLNTLEKCCVCGGRILDRILRATGKPYHPHCFTCVVCGKCLDGIPFTVDAANQIYCIDDFHKQFAPRCCVCNQPIMPEPGKEETVRVVALDRSFHVQCYQCEDCGLRFSVEPESKCYPLDDHILCRSCNAKRVQALTCSIATEL